MYFILYVHVFDWIFARLQLLVQKYFQKCVKKVSSCFLRIFHTISIMHRFLKILYDVEFQSQFGLLVISYIGLRIFMELPNIFVCSSCMYFMMLVKSMFFLLKEKTISLNFYQKFFSLILTNILTKLIEICENHKKKR